MDNSSSLFRTGTDMLLFRELLSFGEVRFPAPG